jgi:hypothetical protein
MAISDSATMCQVIFWQSTSFLVCYFLIMAYVIVRNKRIFNSQQWFCFVFFLISFVLMVLSAFVNSNDKNNDCFDRLLPLAITETEEAFIISIYTLLVFRMIYIYSKVNGPGHRSERCLGRAMKAQNYLLSTLFITFTSIVWIHFWLVEYHQNVVTPQEQIFWMVA